MTYRVPLLIGLGIIPVLLRPMASTAWLWLLVVGLLLLLDWLLTPRPAAITAKRGAIGPVRMGGTAQSRLVLVNGGERRIRGLARDAWEPSAGAGPNRRALDLPPGEAAVLDVALTPTRRGVRRSDRITVRSVGPLGLTWRQRALIVPGQVRTLPAFTAERHLPSRLAILRELDGRAAVRVRGQGTEFDSLREYVRGDDVRSIDWRASARNRSVVVRTWQPERDRRVVVVLDTSRTSAVRVGDTPRLDASMEAALLLVALAQRAGDRVDFVAVDSRERVRVRAAGQEATLPVVLSAMSDLQPALVEVDGAGLAGIVAELTRQRAFVVLLTALEPAAIEQSLLPVLPSLATRHRVVVASVRDPALDDLRSGSAGIDEVYAAAAAAQVIEERANAAALLELVGVDVVDAAPDDLPVALTDHYLALKAAGQL